jgi:drug/metabolite transporter (DMT)-like permease
MALPLISVLVIVLSGLLSMAGLYFYLTALQSEEASVVAPFFQLTPIFAYGLAYLVLGETLTPPQMIGGAAIVGGGLLLSLRLGGAAKFKLRLAVRMILCALAFAVSSLIFKIFAISSEFWTTMFWTFAGQAIFGGIVFSIRRSRREFFELSRKYTGPLITINVMNELINLGGSLGARYALVLAPLSLVQAITSTTALFVFIFGIAVTLLFPALGREDLSPRELLKKGLAGVLIGIGTFLVTG